MDALFSNIIITHTTQKRRNRRNSTYISIYDKNFNEFDF